MAETPDTRIGTVEREQAVDLLTRHLGAGRLTLAEFEDRCARVEAARTHRDLAVLFTDLPAAPAPGSSPRRRFLWALVPLLLLGLYGGFAAADLTSWFVPVALAIVVAAGLVFVGTRRRRPREPAFLAAGSLAQDPSVAPRRALTLVPYALAAFVPALMLRQPVLVLAAVGFLIFAVVRAIDDKSPNE